MNTVVARVLRVLTGHSPIALIHAVDKHGHDATATDFARSTRTSCQSLPITPWRAEVVSSNRPAERSE